MVAERRRHVIVGFEFVGNIHVESLLQELEEEEMKIYETQENYSKIRRAFTTNSRHQPARISR